MPTTKNVRVSESSYHSLSWIAETLGSSLARRTNINRRSLTITYRKGKPIAAYLYLDRRPGDTAARSVPHESGLVVDYAADGRAIGVEVPSPQQTTASMVNEVLRAINLPEAAQEELAPLQAG